MKINAIKTLAAFVAVLLFMGGTLFAQQGPGSAPDAVADPHVGMTVPAEFVMPADPTIGVVAEDGSTYGIYKKIPVDIKTNMQFPPTGPEVVPNEAPNYWNVNISYYTDPSGNEFSVKYTERPMEDRLPVATEGGGDLELLEKQMAAWEEMLEAEHE